MDIDTHNELETKSGIPLDAVVTHAEMMRAFDAFKETNDQRLALEQKRAGDVGCAPIPLPTDWPFSLVWPVGGNSEYCRLAV